MSNRIKIFIMSIIILTTMVSYFFILKLVLDYSDGLEWPFFFWFFGGVAAYAILHYSYKLVMNIGKKRHATLNKNTIEIYASLRDFFH